MAHEWEWVNQGFEGVGNYGKRRCQKCGAEQTKHDKQSWMRITGYRWEPLVGRCPADRKPERTPCPADRKPERTPCPAN